MKLEELKEWYIRETNGKYLAITNSENIPTIYLSLTKKDKDELNKDISETLKKYTVVTLEEEVKESIINGFANFTKLYLPGFGYIIIKSEEYEINEMDIDWNNKYFNNEEKNK